MRWTREKPTQPGRYLIKMRDGSVYYDALDGAYFRSGWLYCLIPDPDPPLPEFKVGDKVLWRGEIYAFDDDWVDVRFAGNRNILHIPATNLEKEPKP